MISKFLCTAVAIVVLAPAGLAQDPQIGLQIVDLPVFAADGIKIGRVADVSMSNGRIDQIRISTASTMGLGERIVTVPQPAFTIKGDMVLIPDLSSEDVAALPSDASESHGVPKDR
jgi:sporulation protein YlmC with PRC-barrel domain